MSPHLGHLAQDVRSHTAACSLKQPIPAVNNTVEWRHRSKPYNPGRGHKQPPPRKLLARDRFTDSSGSRWPLSLSLSLPLFPMLSGTPPCYLSS